MNARVAAYIVLCALVATDSEAAKKRKDRTLSPEEVIARTLFFEDTRHPHTPADSIWNRASRRARFDFRNASETYKRVSALINETLDRKQYSCWNSGKLWKIPIPKDAASKAAWNRAMKIAHEMVMGCYVPTSETTHYAVVGVNPYWAASMRKDLGVVGKHQRWEGV